MTLTVQEVVRALEEVCPAAWAEPWDNVGLAVGDPAACVERILVTLDTTHEALDRAVDIGASLIVTHHPLWLGDTPRPIPGPGAAGTAYDAVRSGVALIAEHTNLDRTPGAPDRLVEALGLPEGVPLESGMQRVDLVTVFVPDSHASAVREAMVAAGGGHIGLYEECSFEGAGAARFTPGNGASPAIGVEGVSQMAGEVRVEMVAPRGIGERVAQQAASAHPYREPLVVVSEVDVRRGAARLGRLTRLGHTVTLAELVGDVAARLGCVPRVWGDPGALIESVGVATGSGGSLIQDARAAGADVLVAGEVRYHDALDAMGEGLCIVEAGHDVTEWPLVQFLGEMLRSGLPLPEADIVIDTPRAHWWTP